MTEEIIKTQSRVEHDIWRLAKEFYGVPFGSLTKEQQNEVMRMKLGQSLLKEIGIAKRAFEHSHIRIAKLLKENKGELQKRIKTALPEYQVK